MDSHYSNLLIVREGEINRFPSIANITRKSDHDIKHAKINIWKRENKTFFLKEITEKPINKFGSFVDNWICERFEQEERELIEAREQEELRRMKDNIDKAREDLRKRIELARQENKTEGGADANDRTN